MSRRAASCGGSSPAAPGPRSCSTAADDTPARTSRPTRSPKSWPSATLPSPFQPGSGAKFSRRGGPAGDLYVFLSVRRHQLFEREGADVHCRVPISMVQATLGGNIEVPTLDGKMARINVPASTQGGPQFRLRGKGMPIVRSSQHGDMYIEINVETPTNLTAKQKELLKEFEKAGKTSPESEGFFSKVKEMFGG